MTTAPLPIRVLLVDDHAVVREGLSALLDGEPDIEVVGAAEGGESGRALARQLHPDVVLMDYSLPDIDGAEATRMIKGECPDIEVIGLSMYTDPQRIRDMSEAGITAFIAKSCPAEELLDAIRGCHKSITRA